MAFPNELARDFLAIGSWIFYLLVLARALIEPYWAFATPMIAGGIILAASQLATTRIDGYTARALTLVYFTTQFYQDTAFSVFAWALFIGVPLSAYLTKRTKKQILSGALIGILAILTGEVTAYLIL